MLKELMQSVNMREEEGLWKQTQAIEKMAIGT